MTIFWSVAENDIDAVVALWIVCGLVRSWNDARRDIDFARGKEGFDILLGFADGAFVSFVMVGHDGHCGWFYYVVVSFVFQGKGLGRATVRAAEMWLRARGIWVVNLNICFENEKVRVFYAVLGYETRDVIVMGKRDLDCEAQLCMSMVRIAAAQIFEFREDVDVALRCATGFALRAAVERASLLCLSECFLQGYLTDEHSARLNALHLGSPEFQTVLDWFSKFGLMIVMGMIEVDGAQLFNMVVVMKYGIFVGCYCKMHLLSGEWVFSTGNDNLIFEVDGLRFGINICYDTNFPDTFCKIADLGGVLVVCPSNNMMWRDRAEAFKMVHNIVCGERCWETGLWFVSVDVMGERDGSVAWGLMAVLNPDG